MPLAAKFAAAREHSDAPKA